MLLLWEVLPQLMYMVVSLWVRHQLLIEQQKPVLLVLLLLKVQTAVLGKPMLVLYL